MGRQMNIMINKKVHLQFELEQRIFQCWNLVDDINVVAEESESAELTSEQLPKLLKGLAELYTLKFQRLQRTFEEYTAAQHNKQDNDAY